MVERMNPALPILQQCRLLALPRSSVYRKLAEVGAEDLAMRIPGEVARESAMMSPSIPI